MQCKCKRLWRQIKTIVYLVHSPHARLFFNSPHATNCKTVSDSDFVHWNAEWLVKRIVQFISHLCCIYIIWWTSTNTYDSFRCSTFSVPSFSSTQLNSVTDFFFLVFWFVRNQFATSLFWDYIVVELFCNRFVYKKLSTRQTAFVSVNLDKFWTIFCYCFR